MGISTTISDSPNPDADLNGAAFFTALTADLSSALCPDDLTTVALLILPFAKMATRTVTVP